MKTRILTLVAFVAAMFCTASGASAGINWDCSIHDVSGPASGIERRVIIHVGNGTMQWRSVPPPSLAHIRTEPWVLRILEDNRTGVVAAFSRAEVDPDDNVTVLGATLVTIDRASGALSVGSVMTSGSRNLTDDLMKGICKALRDKSP